MSVYVCVCVCVCVCVYVCYFVFNLLLTYHFPPFLCVLCVSSDVWSATYERGGMYRRGGIATFSIVFFLGVWLLSGGRQN